MVKLFTTRNQAVENADATFFIRFAEKHRFRSHSIGMDPDGRPIEAPVFNHLATRYDQDTYSGRLRTILTIIDPRNLIVTDAELNRCCHIHAVCHNPPRLNPRCLSHPTTPQSTVENAENVERKFVCLFFVLWAYMSKIQPRPKS